MPRKGDPAAIFLTGGVKPRPQGAAASRLFRGDTQGYMFSFVWPCVIFAVVSWSMTLCYYHEATYVLMAIGICAVFSMMFAVMGGPENRSYTFLGLLCGCAVVFGGMVGAANYSLHMEPYWFYAESREYTNVLPSEPAQAHLDAGKITFANDARIDTTRSVGYRQDGLYCVAPILDQYSGARVEFWAVGRNCCQKRSKFACDDALLDAGDGKKGGLVVLDSGFMQQGFDYYHRAVETAESVYDLVSAPEPVFVRWLHDPSAEQERLWVAGVHVLIATSCGYAVFNALFAWLANKAVLKLSRAF